MSDAEANRIVAGQPYRSLTDFWQRARISRPVTERLVLVGAFDGVTPSGVNRRDLLARCGSLRNYRHSDDELPFDFPDAVIGGLRDLDRTERVRAERVRVQERHP